MSAAPTVRMDRKARAKFNAAKPKTVSQSFSKPGWRVVLRTKTEAKGGKLIESQQSCKERWCFGAFRSLQEVPTLDVLLRSINRDISEFRKGRILNPKGVTTHRWNRAGLLRLPA